MKPNYYQLNDFEAFEFLFKNVLSGNQYQPCQTAKLGYPADVYSNDNTLFIDIPIADGNVEDIKITTLENELKVKYHRSNKDETTYQFYYNGITKRDFELAWKIPLKFELNKLETSFKNGMLKITIPRSEQSYPKEIAVKSEN